MYSCRRFCGQIFSLALSGFFLWLIIHTPNPKFYVEVDHFDLSALSNSSNSNFTLYFKLKLVNPNIAKGIYYDALNLTVFYQPTNGTTVVPGFYQGHLKKATRENSVELRGVDREVVLNNATVVFRVDLKSKVRFKYGFIKSKSHKINVGANVEVNNHDTNVNGKDIRLKSGAAPDQGCYGAPAVSALVIFTFCILNCL